MNNDRSYRPTALELSYNKTEKSLVITLDKGTKHTYSRAGSQYVIIPMYLAKQYGFTVGSPVAVIADEEKRTIKAILDTPKIIPKTGRAICLAALERVKELETTLVEKESVLKDKIILIDSIRYEKAYLKQRLKGGTSDPFKRGLLARSNTEKDSELKIQRQEYNPEFIGTTILQGGLVQLGIFCRMGT